MFIFKPFLVEKGVINQVRTELLGGCWVIQNAYSCVQGEGVSQLMCTYALPLYFFMFLAAFFSCSVLFYLQKVKVIFVQKRCFRHKRLFFSYQTNFCRHLISFFLLKLFLLSKLAKTLLILIRQNLRYTLYFNMIPHFEKTLCNIAQERYSKSKI